MQAHKAVEFQIGDLIPIAVTIAVAGLTVAFAMQVVGDIKEDQGSENCQEAGGFWNTTGQKCDASATNSTQITGNSAAYNASRDTNTGLAEIPSKFGILATVSVAAVVIGVLVTYFLGKLSR